MAKEIGKFPLGGVQFAYFVILCHIYTLPRILVKFVTYFNF